MTNKKLKTHVLLGAIMIGIIGIIIWGYYVLGFDRKPNPEEIKQEQIAQQALLRRTQATASTSIQSGSEVPRALDEHIAIQIPEGNAEKAHSSPLSPLTLGIAPNSLDGKDGEEETPFAIETPEGMVRVKPGEFYFYPPTWVMGINPTDEEAQEMNAIALEMASPKVEPERMRTLQARRNQLFQKATRPEMRINAVIFHLGSRPEKIPNAWEEYHRLYPDEKP